MISASLFQEYFQRYKTYFFIAVLIIFYAVGLFGLTSDSRTYFLSLSFFNLALSFVILLLARVQHNFKFYLFVIGGFFIGMAVEWIGVKTGYLFGDYSYGKSLGQKWFDVPVIIGVNWVMLTMISGSIAQRLKTHWIARVIVATILMLFLDILIEPVAIVSDYWTWDTEIPLSNFIDWGLTALILQTWYFGAKLAEPNKVGISLYIIQVIFFLILNLV